MVHYLVQTWLAARKEIARARLPEAQDICTLHAAVENLHAQTAKATAAIKASHRQQINARTESHRKDFSDLYQQPRKDAEAERGIQGKFAGMSCGS
jgi:hypothetical protein